MKEILIRVTSPYFCAGLVVRDGRIVEAAPILRKLLGMDGRTFKQYCIEYQLRFEVIDEPISTKRRL